MSMQATADSPSLGSGLGLDLEAADFVQPPARPDLPPQSSPLVDLAHSFYPIPIPPSHDLRPPSPLSSAIPFPPSASPQSLPAPNTPSPSLPSTTPRSEKASLQSPPAKESGWTLRGRKSIKSKIGRSLSLASTGTKDTASMRSVSTPLTAFEPPLPNLPTSVSNGHISANGTGAVAFEPYADAVSSARPTLVSPFAPTDPDLPPPHAHFTLPPASPHDLSYSTYPAPPSDDGSSSTVSTSYAANLVPGGSPQRRGSKASVDGGSASGALAATRNLFGRKNSSRPLSSSGLGNGLGLGRLPNGDSHPVTPGAGEGAQLFSSPSVALSRKDAEKRAKEERKEEERKAKERAKAQKDETKRLEKEAEAARKAMKRRSSAVK